MKLKACEVMQQLAYLSKEKIEEVLNEKGCIRKYAYILHDKDKNELGELKEPHWHVMIQFNDSQDTKYIADWFGINENFVSKIKGRFTDALKYLCHLNAIEKHQYDVNDVISNYDWQTHIEKGNSEKRLEEIINLIAEGQIREYNYNNYITATEYVKFRSAIDNAYRYRADSIRSANRHMECIYITGKSGTGKTTYAKLLAEQKGFSFYVSSGTNDVLDGYKGEDCIILDELRPSSLGLADLLKMLDNNTTSTVKSRYRNKVLECRLIIITSILEIEDFYSNVFKEQEEPIIQFKRRCKTHIRFDENNIYVKLYQPTKQDYGHEFISENPITRQFIKQDLSEEEQASYLSSFLGIKLEKKDDFIQVDENMKLPFDI